MSIERNYVRIGVCAALAMGMSAHAAEFAYELQAGYGHSDNIRRVSVDEASEDIGQLGVNFSFDQLGPRLQADLVGDVAYYHYFDDTYDSEVVGNFIGDVRFGFVPQRFEWVVSDTYGQVLSDPFAPMTPDNRENVNVLTTGPDLFLGFGSQTQLRFGGRYTLATYEDRPFDSESVSGELSLIRLLSASSSISLNARAQNTEYDDTTLDADYEQQEAFVRYDTEGARTRFAIDAGYTEIDSDAGEAKDGLLLRFDLARRLSGSSTVTLSAGRDFQNSAGAFAMAQGAGISLGTVPGIQTVLPFTNDYATLGWKFVRRRTALSLSVGHVDQEYESNPIFNQTLTTVGAQLQRDLSPRTSLSVDALHTEGDFEVPDGDYKELAAGLSLRWRWSSSTSIDIRYQYFDRDSDLVDGDYDENRVWIALVYAYGTPRSAPLMPRFAIDAVSGSTY